LTVVPPIVTVDEEITWAVVVVVDFVADCADEADPEEGDPEQAAARGPSIGRRTRRRVR
jgi:hypothetical protein